MGSNFVNHSKLNSQHNRGDVYVHSIRNGIFTLIMSEIFVRAPKIMGKMTIASNWSC
jgi:hypothetical protein